MTAPSYRPGPRDTADLAAFDVARALAALAVLLSHARSFVLLDAADQPSLSWAGQLFMAVSGLGHQAVIVFFVVSGALVTRSLMRLEASGRLSAGRFAASRLTRLWVVLLPCLVLGGLLDHFGLRLAADPTRYGVLRPAAPGSPPALDCMTLLGNLVFLQTIAVPSFGTNGPLWSLANEAWYYVAGFLAFMAGGRQRRPALRFAGLLGLLLLASTVMTATLWLYLPVWLVGAALAPALVSSPRRRAIHARWIVLAVFGLVLAGSRFLAARWPVAGDYALACATAAVLLAFADREQERSLALWLMRGIARFSFSLYLAHLPVIALVAAVAFGHHRLPIGLEGLVRLGAVLALSLAWAWLLWWGFERHTGAVRVWAERLVLTGTPPWRREAPTVEEAAS